MSRAILSSEAIPDTMPRRQVETPREKKQRIKEHDRFAGARARSITMLERSYHHFWIQIKKTRAVIDQPYAHARQAECLVAFKSFSARTRG
jgi:hypothetical protein